MKYIALVLFCFFVSAISNAEYIRYDNGEPYGSYSDGRHTKWEESMIFDPGGASYVKSVSIYFTGDVPAKDTIFITGAPFDFPYPVSGFSWHFSQIAEPIYFDYPGEPGWYEFDFEDEPIYLGGHDYIVFQHRIKTKGPFFVFDDNNDHNMSWLCNVFVANPNFYNIRGTLFYKSDGDYLAYIKVEYYKLPDFVVTQPYPPKFFEDVSVSSGLMEQCNNYLRSVVVSIADINKDGYDDISLGQFHVKNNGDGTFGSFKNKIPMRSKGIIWADYNNDGLMDCYAIKNSEFGVDQLFKQNADGSFSDQTSDKFVIDDPTVTPMFLDYNNDGLLDLFVAAGRTVQNNNEIYYPDRLYKNLGGGAFSDVTQSSGISLGEPHPYMDCWAASLCDYNNDNLTDVFVATYRLAPDLLYRNNGDGTFTEVGKETGVRGVPTKDQNYFGHGMGSDWGDFNNDGYVDLAVGNLAHPDERGEVSNGSLLFENQGSPDYSFKNVQFEKKLQYFEMNSGICWLDIDQDSYLDLIHCNYSYNLRYESVNRLTRAYMNMGPEEDFMLRDITELLGIDVHGAWSPVRFDYDWDGDMDIIIASELDQLKLYRNDYPWKGNWITFRLKGSPQNNVNIHGYGSTVVVYTSDGKSYKKYLPGTIITARSSQNTEELHFGLSNADSVEKVEVTFSDRKTFTYQDLDINRKYYLNYGGAAEPMKLTAPQMNTPINRSVQCKQNERIEWLECGGADRYHLQVAGDENFENIVLDIPDLEDNYLVHYEYEIGKWLFWRVKAVSETDESPWSTIWKFHVSNPSDIAEENIANNLKSYPNPTSDYSMIEFELEADGFVSLNLYDANGNLVKPLLEQRLYKGEYNYLLDLNSLNSGSYYYILSINGQKQTENLILIK
jgi:hypothetical protein